MWFTPAHQRRCRPGLRSRTLTGTDLPYPRLPGYCGQRPVLPAVRRPASERRNGVDTLTEIADHLKGVTPHRPTLTCKPQNWYYVK